MLKLHVKPKSKLPLLRNNKNKPLVDIQEMLVVDGIAQMDNTLQKQKLPLLACHGKK